MRPFRAIALVAVLLVAVPLTATAQQRPGWPRSVTIGSASIGGVYFVVAGGYARVIGEKIRLAAMFVYGSSLLVGTHPWAETLLALATGTLGTLALAAATLGYLARKTTVPERLALLASSLLLIKPGVGTDLVGFGLLAGVFVLQRLRQPSELPEVAH